MIITPPFRWAQQSEVTSAFNIPAIVVASLAPVVSLEAVWYVKPKRSGVSCGGYWRRMVCSLWIEDQYDRVGALPALPLRVDWMLLVVFFFFFILCTRAAWWIRRDSSEITVLHMRFITLHSVYAFDHQFDDLHASEERLHVFVTVRCSTLQHSLVLVEWLL